MKRKACFDFFDRPWASLKEDKSATIVNGTKELKHLPRYHCYDGKKLGE